MTLAHICLRSKLWGKARSYLEACIGAKSSVAAQHELGILLEQMGEKDLALEAIGLGLLFRMKALMSAPGSMMVEWSRMVKMMSHHRLICAAPWMRQYQLLLIPPKSATICQILSLVAVMWAASSRPLRKRGQGYSWRSTLFCKCGAVAWAGHWFSAGGSRSCTTTGATTAGCNTFLFYSPTQVW